MVVEESIPEEPVKVEEVVAEPEAVTEPEAVPEPEVVIEEEPVKVEEVIPETVPEETNNSKILEHEEISISLPKVITEDDPMIGEKAALNPVSGN